MSGTGKQQPTPEGARKPKTRTSGRPSKRTARAYNALFFVWLVSAGCGAADNQRPNASKGNKMNEPPQSRALETSTEALHFSMELAYAGGAKAGAFRYGQESLVRVTYAYAKPPELGTYRRLLPDQRIKAAQEALRKSQYKTLPSPSDVPPGSRTVAFEEQMVGASGRMFTSFPEQQVPAALQPAITAFEALLETVREAPYMTARGAARWVADSVTSKQPLGLVFELQNVGRVALETGNPFAGDDATGQLSLVLQEQGGDDAHELSFGESDVVDWQGPGSAGAGTLTIQPGATLSITLEKRVYLAPGSYRSVLSYQSFLQDAQTQIEGLMPIEPGPLTVTE